jgi:hypothetical protein
LKHFFSREWLLRALEFVESLIKTRDKWVHLPLFLGSNECPYDTDYVIETHCFDTSFALQLLFQCKHKCVVEAGVLVLADEAFLYKDVDEFCEATEVLSECLSCEDVLFHAVKDILEEYVDIVLLIE